MPLCYALDQKEKSISVLSQTKPWGSRPGLLSPKATLILTPLYKSFQGH